MTKEELMMYRETCSNVNPSPSVLRGIMLCILNHLISEAEKPKERRRAEKGERYWFIGMGTDVWSTSDEYFDSDSRRFSVGNYYRTEAEAKAAAERVRKAYVVE